MKILVDALSARDGGGVTYTSNILYHLAQIDRVNKYVVLLSSKYQKNLLQSMPTSLQILDTKLSATPLIRRWLYEQHVVPQLISAHQCDILFNVSEIGSLRAPCPSVFVGGNFSLFTPLSEHPKWGPWFWMLRFQLIRRPFATLSLRRADGVAFVSETYRAHVVQHLKLGRARTRVVHHGVHPIFAMEDSGNGTSNDILPLNIRGEHYILAVSTILPHKNYETLILGFAEFCRGGDGKIPSLVIAGGIGDQRLYSKLQNQVVHHGIQDRVHFLGVVRHDHLPDLYRNAHAFVFPSRLESFGMPLAEAMASGTPVLASNLPICREICGDAAIYFNYNDSLELGNRLRQLTEDRMLIERMREKGLEQAKKYSWHQSAKQMVEFFSDIENRRSNGPRGT